MTKKVFIVSGWGFDLSVAVMFQSLGWDIAKNFKEADLVQFCGGEDVGPELYGERKHPNTFSNPERDKREKFIFDLAVKTGKPMTGICRGGQFLNVMCGGKMWQHVDKHALSGTHEAKDLRSNDVFSVTSTHHQMMRPNLKKSFVILVAKPNLSSFKEKMQDSGSILKVYTTRFDTSEADVEACHYWDENCFCFQPHPEYEKCDWLKHKYIHYINTLLF